MYLDFDLIDNIEEKTLLKLIELALNPPIETIELSESIFSKGTVLPPQPRIEYIDPMKLRNKLNNSKAIEMFQVIDQIISLMPYNEYIRLKNARNREKLEIFYYWKERILASIRLATKIRCEELKAEDTRKKSILLIAPSERQLKIVKGDWTRWAWKRVAYDGSLAPSANGWIRDVSRIAHALKQEGVHPVVVLDKYGGYNGGREYIKGLDIVEIEIPEGMAKIGYPRDQSVTWIENPIICNMSLDFRRGEELVLNEIYYKLNKPPIARARWGLVNGKLLRAVMEGGNFFVIKTESDVVVMTGIGVRGSNIATIEFIASILPEDIRVIAIPIAGYIRDWKTGAVHLDVVFAYLGMIGDTRYALVDPSRMGFYSALEYDRKTKEFKIIEFPLLMKQLGIKISEPPHENSSPITMVNALNLGNGKIVSDRYNQLINKYIEKTFGIDVIEVSIPQIEAGGGGVRCATRELW